jgi:hypothetical protein
MPTTFLKRQKEMKRQEKQREKAERRRQKKLAVRTGTDDSIEVLNSPEDAATMEDALDPSDPANPEPQS